MKFSYSWIFIVLGFSLSGALESGAVDLFYPDFSSTEEMLGYFDAEETKYTGAFGTGLGIGVTLPIIVALSGSEMHQQTDKYEALTAITAGAFWISAGRCIIKNEPVVPPKLLDDYSGQQRINFSKGYIAGAKRKQSTQYYFGVAAGSALTVIICYALVVYAFSQMGPIGA